MNTFGINNLPDMTDAYKLVQEKAKKDYDGDGKISIEEEQASDSHDKQETQRYMAICAFTLMVVITIVMCTPVIPDERVKSLSGLISSMYFALASLCGAYMGFTTWANKK